MALYKVAMNTLQQMEMEPLTDLFLTLASAIYLDPEFNKALRAYKLTPRRYEVLRAVNDLQKADEPLDPREVRSALGISHPSAATSFWEALEKLGYLHRIFGGRGPGSDRRRVYVTMTPKGRNILLIVRHQMVKVLSQFLEDETVDA